MPAVLLQVLYFHFDVLSIIWHHLGPSAMSIGGSGRATGGHDVNFVNLFRFAFKLFSEAVLEQLANQLAMFLAADVKPFFVLFNYLLSQGFLNEREMPDGSCLKAIDSICACTFQTCS